MQNIGAVRAEEPLRLALVSLFVPALDLPVRGALLQILVVFGIAEICPGRWRMLVIAYAATPAVVGLAVFVAWRCRAYRTAGVVIAAIAAVVVLCGISARRQRRPGRDRTGSGSGLPPIQS